VIGGKSAEIHVAQIRTSLDAHLLCRRCSSALKRGRHPAAEQRERGGGGVAAVVAHGGERGRGAGPAVRDAQLLAGAAEQARVTRAQRAGHHQACVGLVVT
jgi:hypothetical protein